MQTKNQFSPQHTYAWVLHYLVLPVQVPSALLWEGPKFLWSAFPNSGLLQKYAYLSKARRIGLERLSISIDKVVYIQRFVGFAGGLRPGAVSAIGYSVCSAGKLHLRKHTDRDNPRLPRDHSSMTSATFWDFGDPFCLLFMYIQRGGAQGLT